MTTQIFKVKGMHCASCAQIITKKLSNVANVNEVEVNYGNEKAKISFDASKISVNQLNQEIEQLGYSLIDPKNEQVSSVDNSADPFDSELIALSQKTYFIMPIVAVVFALMMWDILSRIVTTIPNLPIPMELFDKILMIIATVALFYVGKPYLLGVTRFIQYRVANMDTLIGIGTSVAYLYSTIITFFPQIRTLLELPESTYFDVTIVVIGFITFGKYLEAKSKKKTGEAIEKLLGLQAKTALVIRNSEEVEIKIEEVVHDDLVIIKPGSKIPVDGIIVKGESFVDESMITGEPIPVEKKIGDIINAGTINTTGYFTFRATKIGSETMLSQIIKMVEEAQGSRAPIEAMVDKISAKFVPAVLIVAFFALVLWLSVGTYFLGLSSAISFGILSFVSVLVIACPCALGLATPTAIIVGVGKGAQNGILIKDAETLEKLHKVDTVVVDKTGTITKGKPEVTDINNLSDWEDSKVISILSSLENKSEHPIANAILDYAKKNNIEKLDVLNFEIIKGKGLKGIVEGVKYFAGNTKLVEELGLSFDIEEIKNETIKGKTPIILATEEKVLAVIMVADALKEGAVKAIKDLHSLGIKVIMLSGDDKNTARSIADEVGIDEVVAEVLPEDKLNKIKELQSSGKIVAMAGDGINDAPALAEANVGIAMGNGTDVAIETAGITLLHGDISKITQAIKLSKFTMRGIKQNLFWAFAYNVVGIPLAAGLFYPMFGWLLNPVFAGMAMAFSSVSVVGNSLRLKLKKI